MPADAFKSGCDAITGELRQAWSALDRAGKTVETKLAIWRDDHCHAHHGAMGQIREDITQLRRNLESIEVSVRQMGTPVSPSKV